MTREIIQRLRLLRTATIGCATFRDLIKLHGSAEMVLQNIEEMAKKGGSTKPLTVATEAQVEDEISNTLHTGARIIFWDDRDYPARLLALDDYPPALIAKGRSDLLLSAKIVGIVGARSASAAGCSIATKLAQMLGQSSIVVVSGLARGVDTAAHKGSLDYGTIAVIATGIDVCYPPENRALQQEISERGVVVTEYQIGTQPVSRHFPQRNRIIAGMSKVLAVVEASKKSGSLITAEYALKYGKELFAVPGSPLDSRSSGCNWLIQQNRARIFTDYADVIDAICKEDQGYLALEDSCKGNEIAMSATLPIEQELTRFRHIVHSAIGFAPVTIEELVLHTGAEYKVICVLLLEMEVAGVIERQYGNRVVRIAS